MFCDPKFILDLTTVFEINGEMVEVEFGILTCNEIECKETTAIHGRILARGSKFFFLQLILFKVKGMPITMPIEFVIIGNDRDAAKRTAVNIIVEVTRALRNAGLWVACLSTDRGSNPRLDGFGILLRCISCCVHNLDNFCDKLLNLDRLSIGGVVIMPMTLKRIFNPDNLVDINDVTRAIINRF